MTGVKMARAPIPIADDDAVVVVVPAVSRRGPERAGPVQPEPSFSLHVVLRGRHGPHIFTVPLRMSMSVPSRTVATTTQVNQPANPARSTHRLSGSSPSGAGDAAADAWSTGNSEGYVCARATRGRARAVPAAGRSADRRRGRLRTGAGAPGRPGRARSP